MLAKSWELLSVNSQNPQFVSMLGSVPFVTEGSTSAGPGLSRKVRGLSTENQILPPAIWGIMTVMVLPGLPSGIAQSRARAEPMAGGDVG